MQYLISFDSFIYTLLSAIKSFFKNSHFILIIFSLFFSNQNISLRRKNEHHLFFNLKIKLLVYKILNTRVAFNLHSKF